MTTYVMHSVPEAAASAVPAFLTKLWTLVEDPSCNDLICWDMNGKSFHVYDQNRFSKEVLPLYFKHSNIASFIRQLNMYGFRKVMSLGQGALKIEADDMEFQHPYFQRDQEDLLELIKRKQVSTTTKSDEMKIKQEDVSKVLLDVKNMKSKHDNVSVKLDTLKRENEALWREVATLRQQHKKHEQIVSKLIQFLVSMVGRGGKCGLPVKRTMPLMINDAPEVPSKVPKYSKQISFDASDFKLLPPAEVDEVSLTGPVIHDITDSEAGQQIQVVEPVTDPIITSPATPAKTLVADPMEPSSLNEQLQIQMPTPQIPDTLLEDDSPSDEEKDLTAGTGGGGNPWNKVVNTLPMMSPVHKFDLTEQLDNVQFDIDSLKDLLTTGHYNLDTSVIQGLQNLIEDDDKTPAATGNIIGNEVIQYNPPDDFVSLLDYSNMYSDGQNTAEVENDDRGTGDLNTPQPNSLLEPFGQSSSSHLEDID